MSNRKETSVKEIADFLNGDYHGRDFVINTVCSINYPKKNAVGFMQKISTAAITSLPILWIVLEKPILPENFEGACIIISNPRLAYARVVQEFFVDKIEKTTIGKSTHIGQNVKLGARVVIGEGCVIQDNVEIGDDTIINHHVVIYKNTIIGKSCYIKSGAVIGEEGFGFANDAQKPVRIPHLGKVCIGDHVEIGAKCTIARGTILDTVVANDVKIDDQVHIAHNAIIGSGSLIAAGAVISGSVKLGENAWVGPNACIADSVQVGDEAWISLGAVVARNVKLGIKVSGNFAVEHSRFIKFMHKFIYSVS